MDRDSAGISRAADLYRIDDLLVQMPLAYQTEARASDSPGRAVVFHALEDLNGPKASPGSATVGSVVDPFVIFFCNIGEVGH